MPYYYSEQVKLLLVEHSDEKVEVLYDSNPYAFVLPLIGSRPPIIITRAMSHITR